MENNSKTAGAIAQGHNCIKMDVAMSLHSQVFIMYGSGVAAALKSNREFNWGLEVITGLGRADGSWM